jgi:hypothetical protein
MNVFHSERARKTGGCPPSAPKLELQMNLHKNARTTPHSRLLMVRRVLEQKQAAPKVADFGVSERTVRKWPAAARAGGRDRSAPSAKAASPVIARRLGLALDRRRRPAAPRPRPPQAPRSVLTGRALPRQTPGELVHIDTKKRGRSAGIGHRITGRRSGMVNRHRGIGWEYLHVAVDDAARLAYTEILPDERKASAIAFLERPLAWSARHGVTVERIITDNGNAYRSQDFRAACTSAGCGICAPGPILRAPDPSPRTRPNGSCKQSCANAPTPVPFGRHGSGRGAAPLAEHLQRPPHTAVAGKPPICRLTTNNLLGNDS